eukprot:4217322-Amphidinium_carterae.1
MTRDEDPATGCSSWNSLFPTTWFRPSPVPSGNVSSPQHVNVTSVTPLVTEQPGQPFYYEYYQYPHYGAGGAAYEDYYEYYSSDESVTQSTSSLSWSSLRSLLGATSMNSSTVAPVADSGAACARARTYYYGFYQFQYVSANLWLQYYYQYYLESHHHHNAEHYDYWYYAKYSVQYELDHTDQQDASGLNHKSSDSYYAYYYEHEDKAQQVAQSWSWLGGFDLLRVLTRQLLEVAAFDFEPLANAMSLLFAQGTSEAHHDDKQACYNQYYRGPKQLEAGTDRSANTSNSGHAGACVAFWSLFFVIAKSWRRIQRSCRLLLAQADWLRHLGGAYARESSRDCSKALSIICVCLCDLTLLVVRRIPHRFARRMARKAVLRVRNKARSLESAEDADDQPQFAPH